MKATHRLLVAALLLAAVTGSAQSDARKSTPTQGLQTGTLNGASLPRDWPFATPSLSKVDDPAPTPKPHPPQRLALPNPPPPATRLVPGIFYPAPDGVCFLVRYKSVETADGIVGLKPGTRAVKQTDGSYLADGTRLTLEENEVTRDLGLAQRLASADAAAQAQIWRAAQAESTDGLEPRDDPRTNYSYFSLYGSTEDNLRAALLGAYAARHPDSQFTPERFQFFSPATKLSILLNHPELLPSTR